MKTTHPRIGLFFALMLLISAFTSHAHPYASGITNDNGTIRFVLNEAGGNVTVTYEDGSTNASYDGQTTGLGQPAGTNNSFALGAHSSFKIQVAYVGNGVAKQISSDAANNTGGYGAIRGIDVNKNPTNGNLFGRTYVGNGATLSVNVAPFNSHTKGVFAYNADLSDSPMAYGTNGQGSATWAASTSDPYRITVNNDGTLYLTAFSTADASLYSMSSDLTTVGLVLNPAFEQGQGLNFVHGDPQGVYTTGNIANGNLVVWTSDPAVNAPGYTNLTTLLPNTLGDITSPGDWNNVCRYDIGAGPLPWNQPPNYAVCLGLNNFYDSQNTEVTVTPDGKYVYGVFRRLNFSNGNLQCFDPVTAHLIYTSLHADGTDPWFAATGNQGLYAGVRVTPEGRFIVAGGINNTLIYTFLTNGIPDESTLTIIANTPTSTNARGLAVDAADNILATSSGTGLLRVWSLNYSTTAITGNDSTGTNGTFSIALPPVVATIATSRILGSQNYVNNTNGDVGAPIPAVITVGLSTNYLASPVTVTLATVTSGIQFVGTNASTATFLINTNATTNSDGVLFATTNQIVFPAGAQPRGTNWAFDIVITPATNPISGPTISFKETLISGAGYIIVPPIVQTVSLANTGPQVLTLGAAVPAAASMLRGVPGDYARFFITRTGDTNGPNGGASLHVPIFYTVTNFTFSGTSAGLGVDYTAGPQKAGALGTTIPQDNSPGGPFGSIAINPNETVITNIIGNPVYHTNIYQLPTNVTVIIALTNKVAPPSSTNLLSADSPSYPYQAALATTTITIVDNALAVEPKLLYSNPLTNALDSTNWTLTFLATNFNTVNAGWPLVMKNYSNTVPNDFAGSQTNNFIVQFGAPSTDPGFAYDIPKSPVMLANGWSNVLRMTCNKDPNWPAASAVNVYPQGVKFGGNFALRFDMYLSLQANAINNANPGNSPVEFAMFGINHIGTNNIFRPTVNPGVGAGMGPTNLDGTYYMVDATTGSLTPADYDNFVPGSLPVANVTDCESTAGSTLVGTFKHPPFAASGRVGGSPCNNWVTVSMERRSNGLCNVLIDGFKTMAGAAWTNAVGGTLAAGVNAGSTFTNGTIMLGYQDPVPNVGDPNSQFVFYSNLRVVELSPSITNEFAVQATNTTGTGALLTNQAFNTFTYPTLASTNCTLLVMQGSNVSFTASGWAPVLTGTPETLTNTWYRSTSPTALSSQVALQVDTNATTNVAGYLSLNSTLALSNVQTNQATNYYPVLSDTAGSYNGNVIQLNVMQPMTNKIDKAGTLISNRCVVMGPSAMTYAWYSNNVVLTNTTGSIGGATTGVLLLTNAIIGDTATYTCVAFAAANPNNGLAVPYKLTNSALWTIITAPSSAVVLPTNQVVTWGSTAIFTVTNIGTSPFAYQWKKAGVNLSNSSKIIGSTTSGLTITGVGFSDTNNYTAVVTNAVGSTTSSAGVLSVFVPVPAFNHEIFDGNGNVLLNFGTTNLFDTTNSWTLLSSTVVNGPYTNTPGVVFTNLGSTNFQVIVPTNGQNVFYQLHHN